MIGKGSNVGSEDKDVFRSISANENMQSKFSQNMETSRIIHGKFVVLQ